MTGQELFAANLRRLRKERGYSQEALAADAGIDRAYISELERLQGNPTLQMIDKIAAVLRVSLVEFFRDPDRVSARPRRPSRK